MCCPIVGQREKRVNIEHIPAILTTTDKSENIQYSLWRQNKVDVSRET